MSQDRGEDGVRGALTKAGTPRRRAPMVRYTVGTARTICERVATGETMLAICRDADMPHVTAVAQWVERYPQFARELEAARRAAGWRSLGKAPTKYCEGTAQAIFSRLCAGESLRRICRDPDMPCQETVANWRRKFPEFAHALAVARQVQAEDLCEQGLEIADAATPSDAYVASVRLTQLRWTAGVLAPARYGRVKPVEPAALSDLPKAKAFVLRHFMMEERDDGAVRVVAFTVDPETMQPMREPEQRGEWTFPPGRFRKRGDPPVFGERGAWRRPDQD